MIKQFVILVVFFGAFFIFFSLLYQQYATMEAFPIWDVGVNLMSIYLATHNLTFSNVIFTFFYKFPLLYSFFIKTAFEAVIWQAVVTSSPIIPIYYLTKELTKSEGKAYLAIWLYFINPAVYGENFMPFHMQNLFVPFFISMYYFKIKDKVIPATVLAILASTVRFPYVLLVLWYALTERERNRTWKYILLASSIVMIGSLILSLAGFNGFNVLNQSHLTSGNGKSNIGFDLLNIITPLTILASVYFVYDWFAINLIPAFILLTITTYTPMSFPYIFLFQYGSLYLPQLFITVARTLSKVRNVRKEIRYALGFIIPTFLLLSLISPISITAHYAFGGPYTTLASYPDRVQVFNQVADLIPRNASIITTPNLPELYPRVPEHLYPLIIPGLNVTSFNFAKNQYTVYDSNTNQMINVSVDYIVLDITYHLDNQSIALLNLFYKNGYGIYAVDVWFVVLKYNYTGPPVIFNPPSFLVHKTSTIFLIPGVYKNADIVGVQNDTVQSFGYYEVVGNGTLSMIK
ncbi:MAG: DUF2079 domain-containing protein [Metallosphaera sp.]